MRPVNKTVFRKFSYGVIAHFHNESLFYGKLFVLGKADGSHHAGNCFE